MSGLTVRLQSASPIRLNAAFDCAPGELVALVGPSGSGKTSLLRAIAGLWSAADARGQIVCAGQSWLDTDAGVRTTPQQRRVGLVFQHYALFPHMDVLANVALAAGAAWSTPALTALLDRLGLSGLLERRPAQLSGGQQQRVALARALVRVMPAPSQGPEAASGVLLLDEPFSAVDAPTRQTLYRELAALRQQVAVPMVLVTHDLHEARRLADRVVIMDAGETLQTGTPERVFANPRNARVAELVGIQNHFKGQFFKHAPGWGRLAWQGQSGQIEVRVIDKNKINEGMPVTWVLNGEGVDVLPLDAPTRADPHVNRLRCQLREVLPLGEISLCTLVPEGLTDQLITLNLSGRVLHRLGVGPGQWVQLELAPEALHIMPVR
jgi:molybdate transport system ATP-binding protein